MLAEGRDQFSDRVHHLDRVGSGLAIDGHADRARVVQPVRYLVILHAVDHPSQLRQTHRRPIPVSHDKRAVGLCLRQLPARLHRKRLKPSTQDPGRQIDITALNRICHLINADLFRSQFLRIELNTHRILLRAEHLHLGHPADHRDSLGDKSLCIFIDIRKPEGGRAHQHIDDRLVGGINLLVRGEARHVAWKLGRGFRNGRLHVLRGGIDVPAQVELQRYLGYPKGIGGRHRIQARDGRKLPLQRRGHG